MPYYVKVTPEVKRQILPDYVSKPQSKDGNFLLFQTDLIGVEGNTLQERVDKVGGALLTPDERRAEGLGTANPPAKCYTPVEYGGSGDVSEATTPATVEGAENSEQTVTEVNVPKVIVETDGNPASSTDNEEESEVKDEQG